MHRFPVLFSSIKQLCAFKLGRVLREHFWFTKEEDVILQEQVALVLRNLPFAVLCSSAGAWVISGSLFTHYPVLVGWGACYTIYMLMMILIVRRLKNKSSMLPSVKARLITLLMLGLGLIWAALAYWILNNGLQDVLLIDTVIFACVIGGALAFSSPYMPVYLAFISPTLVLFWVMTFFTRPTDLLKAMYWGVPVYWLANCYFSANSYKLTLTSIKLRFENRLLMTSLEGQICNAQAARQLAEEADRGKSRFLAAASHDLRQPIHALSLFLSAVDRRKLDEKNQEILINADNALKSCREMLEALLDFSRIEAGIVISVPINFSLQPLLFRLFKEFGSEADKRDLVLRLHDTALAVHADPILVELNVRNLLSNAMRYTERGGILIGVRHSRIEQAAILEIWDTGMGIPAKYHQDIFREFYQLGNPERDQRKGLGLGLAIVAGLTRTMGIRVSFKSRWQRGSVFRLHLPLAKQAVVARQNRLIPWHESRNLINCRVLMIDDNEAICLAVAGILGQQGCDSRIVTSIDDAMALLGEWTPEILVTDYRLEGEQTGGDAVRLIRARVGKPLPAIVVTGDTSPDRLREASSIEAILLHKPLSAEKLLNAMTLLRFSAA